jgi:hypothetical protein
MSIWTSIGSMVTEAQNAGLSLTQARSLVSSLTSTISNAVNPLCLSLMGAYGNPAVITDLTTKIAEVPNIPGPVTMLLKVVTNPATSETDYVAAIVDIENAVKGL